MKKIAVLLISLIFVCTLSLAADAALEAYDLLTLGDSLITLDTATNLEWLDITATQGLSYNQAESGTYDWAALGFRHATSAEVDTLFYNAGIVYIDSNYHSENLGGAVTLSNLMGITTYTSATDYIGDGWFDYGNPTNTMHIKYTRIGGSVKVDKYATASKDHADSNIGHYLVRNSRSLVSNLKEDIEGEYHATFGQWFAASFVTDGASRPISSITFKLTPYQFPDPSSSFARVYEDSGGLPGDLLGVLVNPSVMPWGNLGDYTFTASMPINLAPNTRYWVSAGSTIGGPGEPDNRADWHYTTSTGQTGPGIIEGGTYFSYDQGTSWELISDTRTLMFRIEITDPLSDLIVSSVSKPPKQKKRGKKFTIKHTTINVGGGASDATRTCFYLSKNRTLGRSDKRLGCRSIPELMSDEYWYGATKVKIPKNTRPSKYYVLACSDASDSEYESDEVNNCKVAGRKIKVKK